MAYFIVRNSLNPYKAVKFSITLQQQVLKDWEGEPLWLAEINTLEPSVSGTQLKSKFLHLRTLNNLDEEIENAVSQLCDEIDWSPSLDDGRPPYVTDYLPTSNSNVSIDSGIEVVIEESLPSAGIDRDSITMTFNGFDVTNEIEITGDPYEYTVRWEPPLVVRDTYE